MKNYFHKDLPDTLYRPPQHPTKSLMKIIYQVDLQMCYKTLSQFTVSKSS